MWIQVLEGRQWRLLCRRGEKKSGQKSWGKLYNVLPAQEQSSSDDEVGSGTGDAHTTRSPSREHPGPLRVQSGTGRGEWS